jgi:hypothetical protein
MEEDKDGRGGGRWKRIRMEEEEEGGRRRRMEGEGG